MTDFLTRLAGRTFGLIPVAQPIIASRFAPDSTSPESPLWNSFSLEFPASVPTQEAASLSVLPLSSEEPERVPLANLDPFVSERADPADPAMPNSFNSTMPTEEADSQFSSVPNPFSSALSIEEVDPARTFNSTNPLERIEPASPLVPHPFEPVLPTKEAQNPLVESSESLDSGIAAKSAYPTSSSSSDRSSFSDMPSPLSSIYSEPSTPTLPSPKAPVPFSDSFNLTTTIEGADSEISTFSSPLIHLPDSSSRLARAKAASSSFSGEAQSVRVEAFSQAFLEPGAQAISTGVNLSRAPQQTHPTSEVSLDLSNLPNTAYPAVTVDERTYPKDRDKMPQSFQASKVSLNFQNPADLSSSLSLVNTGDQSTTLLPPFQEEVEKALRPTAQASPHASNLRKEQQSVEGAHESTLFLPMEISSPAALANVQALEGSGRKEASSESSGSSAPIVRITIGRIDVRAVTAPSPALVPKASKSSASGPSLEQYLKQGKGGAR